MGPPQTMVRRRRRPSSPAPAAPLEDDDLLGEILLRLPPRPSSLPRASLACKRWRRLVTDRGFLRRLRARHRREPPLLGIFTGGFEWLDFTPLLDPPDRIPAARLSLQQSRDERWIFCGCRHGLALLSTRTASTPSRTAPSPAASARSPSRRGSTTAKRTSSGAQSLALIQEPADAHFTRYSHFQILRTQDGCLGLAISSEQSMQLWERSNSDGVGRWVLRKTLELGKLLPMKPGMENAHIQILGYAEESNVMFLVIDISVFMIQLDSLQFKHIFESNLRTTYYPYINFYAGGRVIDDKDDEPEMLNNT